MLAFLLLLAAPAHAADFSHAHFGASVGLDTVTNDPFLRRKGLHLGGFYSPAPWVEGAVGVAYYPILGRGGETDPDWTPLAKQLLLENSVSPDISKLDWQAQFAVRVYAFRTPLPGDWQAGFGLLAGVAIYHSVDDLVALQNDSDSAVETQSQVHPGTVSGLFWEVRTRHVGFRARYENDTYIETVNSTTLEMKDNAMLGQEVMFWF